MPTFLDPIVDISPEGVGSWQTIDLSSLVPVGTTGVVLRFFQATTDSNKAVACRKTGSTDNRPFVMTPTGATAQFWQSCGVNALRQLDIWIDTANIHVFLGGYFGGEAHFFTNAVDKSIAVTGAWQDVDISNDVIAGHAAVMAFVEIYGLSATTFGLRKKGSTDVIEETNTGARGSFVGLDADKRFQGYVSNIATKIWLNGYLKAGAVVDTNEENVSGSLTNYNWKTLPALPVGAIGGLYRIHCDASNRAGIRCNGSIETYNARGYQSVWAALKCDADRLVEGYQTGANIDMFKYGYFVALSNPVITLSNPDHGATGDSITITGTGFGGTQGAGSVTFNGTMAAITSWSDTAIVTTVPVGATSGDIVVTNDYGRASKGHSFTVTSSDIPDEPDAWPAYPIYRAYRINSGTIPGVGGARIIRGKVIGSGDADAHYGTPVIRIVDIGSGDFDEHYGAECARIYVIGEGDASGYQGYETTQLFTVI